MADMQVRIEALGRCGYPDFPIVCDPADSNP
jgi:hypothetical protein